MSGLPDFEGNAVLESSLRITKAGDGLSDSLKLAPIARHVGEEGFYVLRTACTQVNHKPIKPGFAELERVHTEVVTQIAMVSESDVKALLDAQEERVRLAREAADGIQRLGLEGEDDTAAADHFAEDDEAFVLARHHAAGQHDESPVEGCSVCAQMAANTGTEPDGNEGDGDGKPATPIGRGRRKPAE